MSLLSVQGLSAGYGASRALFGVNLDISPGETVALMGRNGMGKTTTIKAICRMIPGEGIVRFSGHDLMRLPSFRAARLGIGLVPEGRRCFRALSVAENLIATSQPGPWTVDSVNDLFPRLEERAGQSAASLSGGEQQMLAIGRALMTNPRLLILDEATEGLAPLVRQEIWAALTRVKHASEMSLLVVDKSVSELRAISDRGVILERGLTVWADDMANLDAQIVERHIGV
ncbi:MAG: ABC transporter ATP-binding protein [Pseudomonadota bacterium]